MNRKIPQRGAAQNAAELAGSGLALAVLGGGPRSARQRMPRRCQGSVRVPPTPPPLGGAAPRAETVSAPSAQSNCHPQAEKRRAVWRGVGWLDRL